MAESCQLRDTFAFVDEIHHRLRSTAALLGVSENTLRTMLNDSGIEVKRANYANPNAPAARIFGLATIFQIAEYRRNRNLTKKPNGKKPIVISTQIIKGGTGKTTTAAEVTVLLQLAGLKVLGIDIDIQANYTQLMGYEADLTKEEADKYSLTEKAIVEGTFATICAPVVERKFSTVDASLIVKYPFGPSGPAIIPSDTFFTDLETAISKSSGKRELIFQRFFKESMAGSIAGLNVGDFDVVLFDCPPSISFVSTNALACADIVIAPVKMESFSVKGLSRLVEEINMLHEEYPSEVFGPELLILPTCYSTNLPRVSRMNEKLTQYHANISPVSISQSEEFPKSTGSYLPLSVLKPTSSPVKEYREFVDHLLRKILHISNSKTEKNV